jgi:ribose transport system substrate-binding protein
MRVMGSRAALASAVLAGTLAISACGSSGDNGDTASTASKPTGSGSDNGAATAAASKAKAEKAIAPFVGQPSAFTVTEPLAKKPPASLRLGYMQCPSPICGLFGQLAQGGAKAMGVKFTAIKTGQSADAVNAAFNAAIASKYDGLMVPAIDPTLWSQPAKKLVSSKTPISTAGIINGEKFGLTTAPNVAALGRESIVRAGTLMADWIYAKYGEKANVQFNLVPELAFSTLISSSFEQEMTSLCPKCEVRELKIPITTLGNSAPQLIVSDLQAHPKTTVVAAGSSENMGGLPTALKVAGLRAAKEGEMVEAGKVIATVGEAGGPSTLQDIKDGKQTVDLTLDAPVVGWTLVDAVVRGAIGQKIDPQEAKGLPPTQFLSQSDIKFDPSKGWTGYPDFAQRFIKLWKGGA